MAELAENKPIKDGVPVPESQWGESGNPTPGPWWGDVNAGTDTLGVTLDASPTMEAQVTTVASRSPSKPS